MHASHTCFHSCCLAYITATATQLVVWHRQTQALLHLVLAVLDYIATLLQLQAVIYSYMTALKFASTIIAIEAIPQI